MIALDIGAWFGQAVGGNMVVAVPVALVAGLLSFFSPCVLPLLPGYLSYASGLGAAEVVDGTGSRRRLLLGSALFILGVAVVFVTTGALFGGLGASLLGAQRLISVIAGVVMVVLGLVFAGWVPWLSTTRRPSWAPRAGVAAAPLLGIGFAVGWTPCIGPTLAVVYTMAMNEASAGRGAFLAFVYTLGLGVPFLLAAFGLDRLSVSIGWIRRHQRAVSRAGGLLLISVGVAMVTGWWDQWMAGLRQWAYGFGAPI